MNRLLKVMIGVAGLAASLHANAQLTFYEGEGFQGRSFHADRPIDNFDRFGFNDRASSAIVDGGQWLVCEHANFEGRCAVLQPGRYGSFAEMGLNDRISSVRMADGNVSYANEPAYVANADNGRGNGERLYEAPVTSVHAVVGPPEQRCWVERQQVEARGGPNIVGGIAGAVIGGVLGHQIGSGRGNDVATVGGAIAGGAIGANVGRGSNVESRDVQRCTNVSQSSQPAYYDVTYSFNGVEHRVQTNDAPGSTITVNRDGEPRV